jgi:hypothetical protein
LVAHGAHVNTKFPFAWQTVPALVQDNTSATATQAQADDWVKAQPTLLLQEEKVALPHGGAV